MAFADKFITIMEGGYAGAVSTVPLHIMVHAIEFRYLKSPRATFFFKRLGSSLGAPHLLSVSPFSAALVSLCCCVKMILFSSAIIIRTRFCTTMCHFSRSLKLFLKIAHSTIVAYSSLLGNYNQQYRKKSCVTRITLSLHFNDNRTQVQRP